MLYRILTLTLISTCVSSMDTYSHCSRMCPCSFNSLFCKDYGYSRFPSDLQPTIVNIDFQNNELTELTDSMFRNLTRLKKLLLGGNRIGNLSKTSFLSLTLLEALDLSDNLLTQIPVVAFEPIAATMQHLTIEGNSISQIEGLFKNMKQLKTLNARRNHIRYLTAETFFQNKKLRFLQLSNNRIADIKKNTFKRLSDLAYLYLDNNNLENVTELHMTSKALVTLSVSNSSLSHIPRGLPKSLKQLNLSGNKIKSIVRKDLLKLRSLEALDLSRNEIAKVDHKAFLNTISLETMYLSSNSLLELPRRLPVSLTHLTLDHNLISYIPKDSFQRCPQLTALALDNNMIEYMHKKAFSNMTSLKNLQLNNNVLTRLPPHIFRHLMNLETLDLSNNPLTLLEAASLDGLCNLDSLAMNNLGSQTRTKGSLLPDSVRLRILDLYNSEGVAKSLLRFDLNMYFLRSVRYLNIMKNNLQTLPQTFPQYLPSLYRLQLSDNPWSCTRDLYWLQTWLVSGKINEPHRNHLRCETPQHLRGRQLISLSIYDWVMSYTTTVPFH